MTDTPNLGLPFIDGGQAQKHVTHNEALRILDAVIQVAVLDRTRTAPPSIPAEGARHIAASGATGAWAGHAQAIATWQDGAWAFLLPKSGWCVWSVADDEMMVFDGTLWRAVGAPSLDGVPHLGINATADASNLLSVKSNAALFAAINTADAGSGDVRLQLSKENAAKTASVVFAANYSGRAEFGLVGGDAFKLKVSADGASWVEAFTIDQASGNLALPRGVALTGVIAPAVITANQNNYAPTGFAAASVVQISADAARSLSGLAGGSEGRVVTLLNVGSQPITLLDENAASTTANRFALGGALTLAAKQAAILRYDGTATRWQNIAGGLALRSDTSQALSVVQQNQARANAGVPGENLVLNGDFRINQRGYASAGVLAAAAYGHDRWKAGASGGNYSFTQLKSSTQITIAASKTVMQVIEDANVVGGAYVLSWTGTCQARVGINSATPSGAYASSPIVISGQTAGTVMSVEFGNGAAAGTLGTVKLEAGTLPTPFVSPPMQRELAGCRRYFRKIGGDAVADVLLQGYSVTGQGYGNSFAIDMRAAPVITRGGTFVDTNISGTVFYASASAFTWQITCAATGYVASYGNVGFFTLDAEL